MSSHDLSSLFHDVARAADVPLRIVLLPGEALRLPAEARPSVCVLSGTAWVTTRGKDIILTDGQCLSVEEQAERPVISGVGSKAVMFEVC
jgi:hypothetical protein